MLKFSWLLSIILFGVVIYLLWKENDHSYSIEYIIQEKPIYVEVLVPKLIYLELPTEPIDTLAIIEDYYSRKIYIDTLKLDNNGTVILKNNLYKNSIDTLSFTYSLNIKQVNYNYLVGIQYGVDGFNYQVGYSKRRINYLIGYTPKVNNFSIGIQYRF